MCVRLAPVLPALAVAFLPVPIHAETKAYPTAAELARALNGRNGQVISAFDIRVGRCIGPDEEPTEFECTWRQRTRGKWERFKTWFAIDGDHWVVIDWPPSRN